MNCESTATVCYNCGQWGHMARSCPEKRKGKPGKGESKGDHKGREMEKTGNGWWWTQKGDGKGKGLRSVNEYDEPTLSLSCGENNIWKILGSEQFLRGMWEYFSLKKSMGNKDISGCRSGKTTRNTMSMATRLSKKFWIKSKKCGYGLQCPNNEVCVQCKEVGQ